MRCAFDGCHDFEPAKANAKYCPQCHCYSRAQAARKRIQPRKIQCARPECSCIFETRNAAQRYCKCPEHDCTRKARVDIYKKREREPKAIEHSIPMPPTYDELKRIVTEAGGAQSRITRPPHSISLRVRTSRPVAIVFTSDWQVGSEGVDYDQFFDDIELIADHPALHAVVGGDGMDLFIKRSLDAASRTMAVSPTLQVATYEKVIERLGKSLAAMGTGNHEEQIFGATGIDWLLALARRKRIAYTGHGALIELQVGRETYAIFRRHKTRFFSSFNRTHTLKRLWEFAPEDAEVLVGEHKHVATTEPFERHGRQRWAVMCGTYKTYDRYAEAEGYYGMRALSPAVVFWPREHRMLGFVDFHDAVDHLRPWYETPTASV